MKGFLILLFTWIITDYATSDHTIGDKVVKECIDCALVDVHHISDQYHVWVFQKDGDTIEYVTVDPYLKITVR